MPKAKSARVEDALSEHRATVVEHLQRAQPLRKKLA